MAQTLTDADRATRAEHDLIMHRAKTRGALARIADLLDTSLEASGIGRHSTAERLARQARIELATLTSEIAAEQEG